MINVYLRFVLNAETVEASVRPNMTLLELLRYNFKLTGTKKGCNTGDCGACTVLLDGKPVNSCMVLVPKVNGRNVMTVEGLGKPDNLRPLQEAFIEHKAMQFGYCTPGMLLSAKALLNENDSPSK